MSRRNGSNRDDDAKFATHEHGEKHSIRTDEEPYLGPPVAPTVGLDHNGNVDITTGQKMLSAVSGSLFTSLIGSLLHLPTSSALLANNSIQ
jgi:hypothetical protein